MWRWFIITGLLISVVGTWYVIIYSLWRGWGPYIRSKRQKKVMVNATIKAKVGRHEFDPVSWQHELIQKVIIFECEDGVDRDYEVHDDVFDWVEMGDDGVLVYQGHLFVDFEARVPRQDLDKAFRKFTRT